MNALVTTNSTAIAPLVTIKGSKAVANSRDVAALFGKRHHNVLRDIDRLVADDPSNALNFEVIEVETKVGFGVRKDRAYDMDRDGFTLLAMGFTGKTALQFKKAYIKAFNEMEQRLSGPLLPDFTNPAEAARAWAAQYEQRKILEAEKQALLPAARVGNLAVSHTRSIVECARKLPGVNSMQTQNDLKVMGYL